MERVQLREIRAGHGSRDSAILQPVAVHVRRRFYAEFSAGLLLAARSFARRRATSCDVTLGNTQATVLVRVLEREHTRTLGREDRNPSLDAFVQTRTVERKTFA